MATTEAVRKLDALIAYVENYSVTRMYNFLLNSVIYLFSLKFFFYFFVFE